MRDRAVTAPSERTEDGPSRITEFLHGRRDTAADDVPAFRRVHLELFVPVDDRARLQQDGRHPGRSQHDELIVAIDTGFLVQQRVLVPTHDGLGILPGILQALGLHFLAEQFGEREARLEVRIVAGNEDRITAEPVAEMAFLALEFPVLEEFVGHGVMVDRQEEIRVQMLAAATRLTRLGLALPSVRCARRRLKTNSATLRALVAPSDSAVCPTSRTIRNFEGSHIVATGFKT